jgi:ABC-type glycerol-3-phosphate transport system permease component
MTPAVETYRRPRSISWLRPAMYVLLAGLAVLYLLPVYVLVVTSMKSFAEVNLYRMWDWPARLGLDSFVRAWAGSESQGFRGLSHNFWNSVRLGSVANSPRWIAPAASASQKDCDLRKRLR